MDEAVDVRRGAQRATTRTGWLESHHSFSFGSHYDPANVGFSVLVAHNDDTVAAGHGYDTHPHADTEIVTWVLSGALVHRDSDGRSGVLVPGRVQRLSAGRGISHSERNDAPGADEPTRFVQMWLRPDESGLPPAYDEAGVGDQTGLLPLVSGVPGLDAPVRIHTSGAVLHLARPAPGSSVLLPDAPRQHVFVARGAVDLEGAGGLAESDAARLTGDGGRVLTADGPCEVLVWSLPERPWPG